MCFYLPLHFKRILLTILTCPPHILTFKNLAHRDEEVSSLSTLTHFSVSQLTALRAQFEEIADAAAGTASARISSKTLQDVLARTTPEWPAACTNRLVDILAATSAAGLRLGAETLAKTTAHGVGSGAREPHRRAMSPLMRRKDGTEGTETGIDFRTLMCAISVLRNGRVEERLRLVFRLFARSSSSTCGEDLFFMYRYYNLCESCSPF